MVKRIFLIVLDGAGVGELPDASIYGDQGSNTLGNLAKAVGGLNLPNMEKAGLGRLTAIEGVSADVQGGVFGKMAERSAGKDTTTGHWEMAGLILERPLPTFPGGFPKALLDDFLRCTGKTALGNKAASGITIIEELGAEHLRTGSPIVYTSADSVFQIAAHEEVMPLQELYHLCEIAREMLKGEWGIGRVIARPFTGKPGSFVRTEGRKDYSLKPFAPTVLDRIKAVDLTVFGVGKIEDIFVRQGLTDSNHTRNNPETLAFISELMDREFKGLVFANCVDFDMLYGHRNDAPGYAAALKDFDKWLGENLPKLRPDDYMIVTGDHGGDPTTSSTDHSREYTPLLVFTPGGPQGIDLGIRESFSDIAASLCYWFNLEPWPVGKEFASRIEK